MLASKIQKISALKKVGVCALFTLIFMAPITFADDVEVYLVPPPEPIPPNVLFILDESGSMSSASLTAGKNRNQALKDAMAAVIDDPDLNNVNTAIMGYTTISGSSSSSTNMRMRIMHDFLSMDTVANQTALKAAVNTLQMDNYTPTVNSLIFGLNWFKSTTDVTGYYDDDDDDFNNIIGSPPLNDSKQYCQKNSIVLLTDGEPNANSRTVNPFNGLTCASDTGSERCGTDVARWAFDTDLRPDDSVWPTNQNVTTHSVIMINNGTAQNFMRSIACAGHGKDLSDPWCNGSDGTIDGETYTQAEKDRKIGYYLAGGEDELVDALKSVVQDTQSAVDYSFNTPQIPLNTDNAAVSGDYIYVPILAPDMTDAWKGNLKKYKFEAVGDTVTIKDADNNDALNDDLTFKDGSRSFWSSTDDGNNPLIGGAAEQIYGAAIQRTIYTNRISDDLSADEGNNLMNWVYDSSDPKAYDCNQSAAQTIMNATTKDQCNEIIDWLTTGSSDTGVDDSDGEDIIDYKFGAPIHTKPVVLKYGTRDVIFMPTSDGVLHAIEGSSGAEIWGYVPQELLHDILQVKTNADNQTQPIYGLDGNITVVHDDTNNSNTVDGGESVLLVFGQRRGGKSYFAIDVSVPDAPKYKYQLDGEGRCSNQTYTDSTSCGSASEVWTAPNYPELGQTWSQPIYATLDNSAGTEVLIFGGGYDTSQDASGSTRSSDSEGDAVYIVNVANGNLVKKVSNPGHNGIVTKVSVVDLDRNGKVERIYASDVGGRILRIDYKSGSYSGAGIIADMGGSPNIKFFNSPNISYVKYAGDEYIAITLGSGDRAAPLDDSVTDSFFMIKDYYVWSVPSTYTAVTRSNLKDLTSAANYKEGYDLELKLAKGWLFDLPTGVKVFSKALVTNYKVFFTAFSGDKLINTDICNANGVTSESSIYAVTLLSASAIYEDFDGDDPDLTADDRVTVINVPGIPPSPSILLPDTGGAKIFSGLHEVGDLVLYPQEIYWEEIIE